MSGVDASNEAAVAETLRAAGLFALDDGLGGRLEAGMVVVWRFSFDKSIRHYRRSPLTFTDSL